MLLTKNSYLIQVGFQVKSSKIVQNNIHSEAKQENRKTRCSFEFEKKKEYSVLFDDRKCSKFFEIKAIVIGILHLSFHLLFLHVQNGIKFEHRNQFIHIVIAKFNFNIWFGMYHTF